METVRNIVNSIIKNKNAKTVLMIVGAIAIVFLIYKYISPQENKFTMFYIDNCKYCKEAKPEFAKLMENGDKISINGKEVKLELVDGNDETNNELLEKFDIGGYPTFVLSTGEGRHTKFIGARTESLFQQFLQDKLK